MIQNLAKTNNFPLGTIEFEVWSHVPNLGYRLMAPVSVTQDNVDNYFKDVKKIITYGEEHDIEVSSLTSGFYRGESSANIYISTLFMDLSQIFKLLNSYIRYVFPFSSYESTHKAISDSVKAKIFERMEYLKIIL